MKASKILTIALSSVFVLSAAAAFAGCGDKNAEKQVAVQICYDNIDDDYAIPARYTQYEIADVTKVTEVDAEGKALEAGTVATYDEATHILTGKGKGLAVLTLKNGETFTVEVAPAYVTNPHNQYTRTGADVNRDSSKLLGSCHDPSLIEVKEEDGTSTYYIFSTGWSDYAKGYGNDIRKSKDLIHWEFVGKPFSRGTLDSMMNGDVGKWLYDGKLNESYNWFNNVSRPSRSNDLFPYWASWWAPDIVPAADGGYWLYTCVVDGTPDAEHGGTGVPVDGESMNYTRACILLCHSDSLAPESFRYEGVLMQSSIPFTGSGEDVNAIDPQIIYSPDGKMYMAYGSFGTGNYMLELDPKTGFRKDGVKDWKTHNEIRTYVSEVSRDFNGFRNEEEGGVAVGWEHAYYGKNISKNNMEAPVIARHDNVKVFDETASFDENGEVKDVEGKTYYYSMHSYNGLAAAYQMWGGRSESVWGVYRSVNGGIVFNEADGNRSNEGNKYMGTFKWSGAKSTSIDITLPGHNDLFTTKAGVNVAAYITRSYSFDPNVLNFVSQVHQYYLNSQGDIVINPNRYGGESTRPVTKEEIFKYTDGGKFKMVALCNKMDKESLSEDVTLTEAGKITYQGGEIGTWTMYGNGYIKLEFTNTKTVPNLDLTNDKVYYGVVRTAWLDDQNKSGITITCMGHTKKTQSMALFMNGYSTITGEDLVG